MVFNSSIFIVFAAAFFLVWKLMPARTQPRWAVLVVASYLFYGWWDWRFLFLITASGLLDFVAAIGMERYPRYRRALLLASIAGNVGALATFKYAGFLTDSLNALLRLLGPGVQLPPVRLTLPIGISFYTFQSMSYTFDVYKGSLRPTRNPLHFFAYLAMFPQLVAGPIVRAADLLPQLEKVSRPTDSQRWQGLKLLAHGYFKKTVLADNLAPAVNAAFGWGTAVQSCPYWWVAVTMFAFQIYCDFSGYTDIARGLGKWMGYEYPVNFGRPYSAASFRDFWRRWHISLSTWFRDYVYIPLGGSRRGTLLSHRNMWATLLVAGLWHGAAWTFVIWGALHAAYLSFERVTRWPQRMGGWFGGRFIVTLLVLVQVWIGWVFFRAESLPQAVRILRTMLSFDNLSIAPVLELGPPALLFLLVALASECYSYLGLDRSAIAASRLARLAEPVLLALMIAACVYLRGPGSAFIYFQF